MALSLHGSVSSWLCLLMALSLHGSVSSWLCLFMALSLHGYGKYNTHYETQQTLHTRLGQRVHSGRWRWIGQQLDERSPERNVDRWVQVRQRKQRQWEHETYADVLDGLASSVVPEPIVKPQSDQLQRWLWPVHVLRWHIEVIHERQHLLATDWNVDALGPLLHATFYYVLNVVGWRLSTNQHWSVH